MPDTRTRKHLKISVKKLVDFACRSGDLTHEGLAGPTAQEGQAAHKQLQAVRSPDESAEVKVTADIVSDQTTLLISGRVDLLVPDTENPAIGEIKSCYAPLKNIPLTTRDLHWSQLKIYGFCVLNSEEYTATSISLRLIWANVITNELNIDESAFRFEELAEFTTQAARRYIQWMEIVSTQQLRIIKSAKALTFPHVNYRDGQRNMAGAVYITARERNTLLCEAPTGIGKTISTIFPAVKAIGEGHVESVVYLTAKTSGRESAIKALQQLIDNDLFVSAITITSKKNTCHCSNGTCERDEFNRCPLTIGFFDRLPDARNALLQQGVIHPSAIDAAAHQYMLCPFELTLQMLPWVSVVICDYNYVFDPLVRLGHFNEFAKKTLLLVDEAHNLTDRARSMYSAQLNRQQILKASDECQSDSAFLGKALRGVANALDRWAKQTNDTEFATSCKPATVTRAVAKCVDAMASTVAGAEEKQPPATETQIEVAKELFRYLVIEDLFGDHHRTLTTQQKSRGNKQVIVKLQCLNATNKLESTFKQFRASVAFSATLRPLHYVQQSLGLPQDTHCVSLPSPFNADNQGVYLCNWVDTRYRARDSAVAPIVEIAHNVYLSKPGNYQILFPSYAFMESVHTAFCKRYPSVPTIIQQRGSSDHERAQFLSAFDNSDATLAFAITGGIYGEGVDYLGDKLLGAIVVGTGLASVNLQQKLIEEDYLSQGMNGFDYGSRYPGFTRVLQTAGRVIRSETDTGIVVLVDQRFAEPFYAPLYPQHWQVQHCNNPQVLFDAINSFWTQHFSLTSPPKVT